MTPEARWLAAGALAIITMACVASWRDCHPQTADWTIATVLAGTDDQIHTAPGAAADLESRWVGHPVVVKHFPAERHSQLFAHLDNDRRWTSNSVGHESSSIEPAVP